MNQQKAEQQAREIDSRLAYQPAPSDRVDTITTAILAAYQEGKKEGKDRVKELEGALRAVLEAPKSKRLAAFKTAQAVLEKGENNESGGNG